MNIFHEEAGDAPLRQTGVIDVSFTPRTFPTPSRESVAPEEEAVSFSFALVDGIKS